MMGYIQVYTGDGKGKTTAALGLSLRAICAGKKVFFGQFLKGVGTSELCAANFLNGFTIRQYGSGKFIFGTPSKDDINLASDGLKEINDVIFSNKYDIVVLDEVIGAIGLGVIKLDDVLSLIDEKPDNVELILTGRNVPKEIIDKADLITEMKKIKHYYDNGVDARKGIEI